MTTLFIRRTLSVFIISQSILIDVHAQDYSFVHPSPNVGWSVANLKQDNNLFTGTANIQIPIYSFKTGNKEIPIGLTYNTKAVQVDQLPSWVGLGWNLVSAGQISRVVNGKPDEVRETKSVSMTINYYSSMNPLFPNPNSQTISTEVFTSNDFAYINNCTKLAVNNWNSNDYLFGTLNTLPVAEVSDNIRTLIDQDGQIAPITTLIPSIDLTRNYDFQPDEFDFSLPGGGGKFYLNHQGQWICETGAGNYKVIPLLATNVPRGGVIVPRVLYGFELTAPDGVKYYFGGTTDNKLANTEFWRGPTPINATGTGTDLFSFMGNTFLGVCPNTWHLRRIETPDNHWVNFTYRKGALQLQYADAPWGEGGNNTLNLPKPGYINQSLAEPWYLSQISTSEGLGIDFLSENSQQLGTDKVIVDFGQYNTFVKYADIASYIGATNNMQKLTAIEVKDGSTLLKKFQLNYIENMTERLKLESIFEIHPSSNQIANKYSFTYNTNDGKLPNYGSGLTDYFGYYNNRKFFTDPTQSNYTITREAFETQYNESREPVFSFAKCETLDKIYFPTGGYRQYFYEPNEYAFSVTKWPFSTMAVGSNKITGGIRLAKMIDYNDQSNITSQTDYIYRSDPTGTVSSGVLGILQPQYTEDKSGGGYYFSTRGFIPLDRQESHITYSTVFEKKADGSMSKYEFANYDNTANDAAPFIESPSPAFWDKQPYTDHGFKRGLLKKIMHYDNNGLLVKQIITKYQDEYDDYSRFIRSVRLKHGDQATGTGYRAAAYPQYYFPNLQRYQKNELSTTTGSIITEIDFTYDSYNNITTEQTTNSLGRVIKNTYKYPYHFYTTDNNNPFKKMADANRVNATIEQQTIETKNGVNYITNGSITDFGIFGNNIIKPKSAHSLAIANPVIISNISNTHFNALSGSLQPDANYTTENTFLNYDNKGNIMQIAPRNGIAECVLWGYNNDMYPVAKCVNANLADIATTSFESTAKGQFDFTGYIISDTYAPTGNKVYDLGSGNIAKAVDVGKTYIISLWAKDNSVTVNGNNPYLVGKTRKGYTLYEYKIAGTTLVTISGNTYVDEVRLFPEGAQMTTTTYYPFIGMSSETDAYNRTLFYQYDQLERLVNIIDEDGNIIKAYEYHNKQ